MRSAPINSLRPRLRIFVASPLNSWRLMWSAARKAQGIGASACSISNEFLRCETATCWRRETYPETSWRRPYAFLKNKTTEDLLALQQHAERELKRYEDVERIAATVLAEREEQTSSQN